MAGLSGHNTNISKHRLGCRLPHESIYDETTKPGPVIEYKLDPKDLIQKYGPVREVNRNITEKSLLYAVDKAKTPREAAKLLQISLTMFWQKIWEHKIQIPKGWEAEIPMKNTEMTRKTRLEVARGKLTKEVYMELRAQGLKDKDIMNRLEIAVDVFYRVKKEFNNVEPVNQIQNIAELENQNQVEVLLQHPGQVVISGYESNLYKEMLEDRGWSKAICQSNDQSNKPRSEVIWMNYQVPAEQLSIMG